MMFAARGEYLFFTSIMYGLAACSGAGGEPVRAAAAPAANGGPGVPAAMSSMSASAGTGTSMGAVAMSSIAAGRNADVATGGATAAAGTGATDTGGTPAMTATPASSAGAMAASAGASADAAGGMAAAGGATFTEVFNLLAGGCASGGYCHAAGGGLSKLELVDQTKAYTALVGTTAMGMAMPGSNTMGCSTSMIVRVKAGDPDSSLLMQKRVAIAYTALCSPKERKHALKAGFTAHVCKQADLGVLLHTAENLLQSSEVRSPAAPRVFWG
jgi:hypothetical protein